MKKVILSVFFKKHNSSTTKSIEK